MQRLRIRCKLRHQYQDISCFRKKIQMPIRFPFTPLQLSVLVSIKASFELPLGAAGRQCLRKQSNSPGTTGLYHVCLKTYFFFQGNPKLIH